MGESQTEYTRWISDSSVKAMSTSGLLSSHTMVLTSGIQAGSSSEILSYYPPVISASSPANSPAVASVSIRLFGQNYGQTSFTLSQRASFSSAQRTAWDSDTSISGMPCDGLAASIRLILSAGIRVGTRTRAFTYNIPSLQVVLGRRNFPAQCHPPLSVTFLGSSFGVFHLSPSLRVGSTVTQATLWTSDTSIMGICALGVSSTEGITVTAIIGRVSTRTEVITLRV